VDWQRARKPEQKSVRRQEILDAAYTLFAEHEYDEISLNAIARQARISKPNVYRYFSTREEIFLQIFLETFEAWARRLARGLAGLRRPARARRIAELWTQVTREHPRMLRLAPLLATSMERNCSEERLYAFKKQMHQLWGQVAGELRRVVPSISEKGCFEVLICGYGLIAGLAPMARPNDVLARVMDRPEFASMRIEFDELMTNALTALIEGNTK
jgi:AcrR family transcriptional regulator